MLKVVKMNEASRLFKRSTQAIGMLLILLILYFSWQSSIVEVHFTEFLFMLVFFLYSKRSVFFQSYIIPILIAQALFLAYVTVFREEYYLCLIGGIIYLVAYVVMILYVIEEINLKKIRGFSWVSGGVVLILTAFMIYQLYRVMDREGWFGYKEDFYESSSLAMIFVYISMVLVLTFLSVVNLSINITKNGVLFCLAATCALSSEFSQIFQALIYRGDKSGAINVIDKLFSIASMFFFYFSVSHERKMNAGFF